MLYQEVFSLLSLECVATLGNRRSSPGWAAAHLTWILTYFTGLACSLRRKLVRTVVPVPRGHLPWRTARLFLLCVSLEVFATPTRRYHGRMFTHPSHTPCVCHPKGEKVLAHTHVGDPRESAAVCYRHPLGTPSPWPLTLCSGESDSICWMYCFQIIWSFMDLRHAKELLLWLRQLIDPTKSQVPPIHLDHSQILHIKLPLLRGYWADSQKKCAKNSFNRSPSVQKCIDDFPPPLLLSVLWGIGLVARKTGCPLSPNLKISDSVPFSLWFAVMSRIPPFFWSKFEEWPSSWWKYSRINRNEVGT